MVDIAPTFLRTLITDVLVANEHLAAQDDQAHRRNFIRTTFAAIEGLVWLLRDHVLSVGTDMNYLSPLDTLALQDLGYSVSEKGVLRKTPQYQTLKTAIRYAMRQAREINPALTIDYDATGWSNLAIAIDVRHRITHPKRASDLIIEKKELDATSSALNWLLATVEEAMQTTTAAFRAFNDDSRALLKLLQQGDPEALRLYHEFLNRSDPP